jgi:hypothetical protein
LDFPVHSIQPDGMAINSSNGTDIQVLKEGDFRSTTA